MFGHPAVLPVGSAGEPAFRNGWKNYGGAWSRAGFWKDASGVVHLQGTLTGKKAGKVAFQLPVGYRPAAERLHGGCCREPLDQHRDPRQRRNLDHRIRRGRPRRLDLPGRAEHNHSKTKFERTQPSQVRGRAEDEVSTG
jgi:hypothetical protein